VDTSAESRLSVRGGHLPASPHGPIEELFDGIWFVRGGIKMPMLMPMRLSIVNSNALCAQRATRHNIWYRAIRTRE